VKPWHAPSGRQRGIPFILPDDWSPEQALAVVELLDDLRDRIWQHYQIPLHSLLEAQREAERETATSIGESMSKDRVIT